MRDELDSCRTRGNTGSGSGSSPRSMVPSYQRRASPLPRSGEIGQAVTAGGMRVLVNPPARRPPMAGVVEGPVLAGVVRVKTIIPNGLLLRLPGQNRVRPGTKARRRRDRVAPPLSGGWRQRKARWGARRWRAGCARSGYPSRLEQRAGGRLARGSRAARVPGGRRSPSEGG